MRVLFCVRPSYGHVYPVMPLAEAARAAGHHVEFATTAPFATKLARLGHRVHEAGITIDDAALRLIADLGFAEFPRVAGRPDLRFGARMFADVLARPTTADLFPLLCAERFDLVLYEQGDFGAAIAAGLRGVPAVLHSISPQWPAELVDEHLQPWLRGIWRDYGRREPMIDAAIGDAYLDIFPAALQDADLLAHPARVGLRPVPWCEPGAAVPARLARRERPLVYVTLGTVVANDETLAPVIEGVAGLDVDVLVALGAAAGADLGALPPNVRTEAFVDQARLMPHTDLVVHHGGSGTVLGALAHGVPQVVLPKGADQFLNADRILAAGLADVLEPTHVTPEDVAVAAKRALAEPRAAVARVQAEIAALPAPADVVEQLAARFG